MQTISVKEYVKLIQDRWLANHTNRNIPQEQVDDMLLHAEQMFSMYMKQAEAMSNIYNKY